MEIKVDDVNFDEEVLKSDIPVLVDFWAEWCGPCHMVAPAVKKIAEEYQGKLKVCKLNVDEARNTASQYGVMSIPTLILFKNGQVEAMKMGLMTKSQLSAFIESNT